jgi:Zn-dependent protease with chaperone function
MDFFASQERAERQTRLMLLLFLVAVCATVLALNLVAGTVFIFTMDTYATSLGEGLRAVPATVYWLTTAVVLAIIIGGTWHRISSLADGGAAVAEMVGARRVQSPGASAAEQRLVNVVEEMAIAAGIRVPLIYVMDGQRGINAFAAGYSPDEAAVTVTQGTLDQLNRDELQGVVAHEFSHILNGDMRLNIRLIGIIAGLVFIGSIGRFLMRAGSGHDDDRIGQVRARGDARAFLLGLAIWLIGAIGVFFGSLIKAAVSRQREFLADASAVKFTRNPEGIGSALLKIEQTSSRVHQLHAEELSHMYFGNAIDNFFATHPPIATRIDRVLGTGAAQLFRRKRKREAIAARDERSGSDTVPEAFQSLVALRPDGMIDAAELTPTAVFSGIGNHSAAHVDYAHEFIDKLPGELRQAVATQAGAKAALYALLLDNNEVRQHQLELVATADSPMTADATDRLAALIAPLGIRARIPVLALAMDSLRALDVVDRHAVIRLLTDLVNADGKLTLAEFTLLTICRSQLAEKPRQPAQPRHLTLQSAASPAATILTLVARSAATDAEALAKALGDLGLTSNSSPATARLSFQVVESALGELKLLEPKSKGLFVDACIQLAMADGRLTATKGELMRAICAALEVPLPPFIGQLPVE